MTDLTPRKIRDRIDSSGVYNGSLTLRKYPHELPEELTGVRGDLYLDDYDFPLPARLVGVGGTLTLGTYRFPLPSDFRFVIGDLDLEEYSRRIPEGFEMVGGDLNLFDYSRTLPSSLKFVGGDIDLEYYNRALPPSLHKVGGNMNLRSYPHRLPDNLADVGGNLILEDYDHALPNTLHRVGGNLSLMDYRFALPPTLKEIGGDLTLENYAYRLPESLVRVAGNIELSGYDHRLPSSLKSIGGDVNLVHYQHNLPSGLIVSGKIKDEKWWRSRPPYRAEHYDVPIPKTQNFKRWFSGSKAVTKRGDPALVYHGSQVGGFSKFEYDDDLDWSGFFFTDNIRAARTYLQHPEWPVEDPTPQIGMPDTTDKPGVYRAFLRMRNPAIIDAKGGWFTGIFHPDYPRHHSTDSIAEEARRRGYDGVIFQNIIDPVGGGEELTEQEERALLGTVYVVFEPTQIKSALFNTGEYNPHDPDIRKNPRRRKTSRKTSRRTRRTSRK